VGVLVVVETLAGVEAVGTIAAAAAAVVPVAVPVVALVLVPVLVPAVLVDAGVAAAAEDGVAVVVAAAGK
jgi:hypothetical protein